MHSRTVLRLQTIYIPFFKLNHKKILNFFQNLLGAALYFFSKGPSVEKPSPQGWQFQKAPFFFLNQILVCAFSFFNRGASQ